MNRLLKNSDLLLAVGVMSTLVVMILPVPAWIMDVLLVLSLTISIGILLLSVYAGKPLDFSVFPTILLFSTLFRLALTVASTRLVLLHGHEGTAAAGHVIESFGRFVVGGSYIVGTVVFVLLIIINFVVITKGSGRVAEVAARFILDAMPGKQMSIDADLNSGLITEDEARERRRRIEREADFYGAMDGASKFVRGDAIAGVLITLINILGGLTIGIFQRGLDLSRAAELYTLMTIGDGLVTQIPSLVVSTAAGIIVTRAASGDNFSKEVARQVLFQPRALGITAGILAFLGILPGIPAFPFLLMALVTGGISIAVSQSKKAEAEKQIQDERKAREVAASDTHTPPEIDALELQVGYGLVSIVEGDRKGDFVDRIPQLRREFAKDLGIVLPKVHIKDNLELGAMEYSILIRGISVAKGELMSGHVLALDPGGVEEKLTEKLPGIEGKEPVFGMAALWVPEKLREKAQLAGYSVVDSAAVLVTHLAEVVRKHAHELVGRQEMQALVENLQKTHPKVVEELIPNQLTLGSVLKVCQNLLREQVPIRDLAAILESLANYAPTTKDVEALTEHVRAALARTITHRLTTNGQDLEVVTLAGEVETALLRGHQRDGGGFQLDPGFFERIVGGIQRTVEKTLFHSGIPVLLCHPSIRGPFKRLIDRFVPGLTVISANEIASFAKVRSVGTVES